MMISFSVHFIEMVNWIYSFFFPFFHFSVLWVLEFSPSVLNGLLFQSKTSFGKLITWITMIQWNSWWWCSAIITCHGLHALFSTVIKNIHSQKNHNPMQSVLQKKLNICCPSNSLGVEILVCIEWLVCL